MAPPSPRVFPVNVFAPESASARLTPASRFVGAIDQGTSSTRFILFDHEGRIVRSAQQEHTQIYPEGTSGWTEHDPTEVMTRIHTCISAVLSRSPAIAGSQVVSLGLTNQRETSIIWDAHTGKPLHNAIVWHDARTAKVVADMTTRLSGGKDHFRPSAGLPLSTYFSATKIAWMMQHVPAVAEAVKAGRARFGNMDSWIIWNLSGGSLTNGAVHVTDVTNASRTLLMDLRTRQWSAENCKEFAIPMSMLPTIKSSSEVYANVYEGPLKGVPIAGCVGDQQAAMLGQLCLQPGQAKSTYGTGAFMLMNTGTTPVPSTHGLLTTVCFQLGPRAPTIYALEGSVAVAGSGVQWLRDKLGVITSADEVDALAGRERDSGDVYFVPAFSGLLSPHWRADARGVIAGLTHASNKSHIARAVLHASAFQTRDVLEAMGADTSAAAAAQGHREPVRLQSLQVDGGMCASNIMMQFQADQLNIPVVRPAQLEATASGAAFCAGLAVGFWQSTEEIVTLAAKTRDVRVFEPSMPPEESAALFRGWKKAVQRSFGWADDCAGTGAGSSSGSQQHNAAAKDTTTQAKPQQTDDGRKPGQGSAAILLSHLFAIGAGAAMGATMMLRAKL